MITRKFLVLGFLLCCLVGLVLAKPAFACTIEQLDACQSTDDQCASRCNGNKECLAECADNYVACVVLCERE
jgi:hypothetical protein